jgi:hypothetical protein
MSVVGGMLGMRRVWSSINKNGKKNTGMEHVEGNHNVKGVTDH